MTTCKYKKRVFGVIYPGGSDGMDLDVFTKAFAKYGGKIAPGAAVAYTSPTDPAAQSAAYQEQAPPLIAKLKQAGVTTVVELRGRGTHRQRHRDASPSRPRRRTGSRSGW